MRTCIASNRLKSPKRRFVLPSLAILILAIADGSHVIRPVLAESVSGSARRPNVVVILADDLGYGDLKCLNPDGKIATPNFDRLSAEGVAFTDAHSGSAVCTPTRYGLLTGRYAWRTPLQNGVLGGLSPRLIEPNRLTLASMLKSAGYRTACIGKWHLGMNWELKPGKSVAQLSIEPREQVFNVEYDRPISNGPTAVGFDYYFGISASLDMVPYVFIENDHVTASPTEDVEFPLFEGRGERYCRKGPTAPGFKTEDVLPELTKRAIKFVEDSAADARAGKPFFLYLPLASPHTPIAPSMEWRGKSGLNYYGDFVMQTDESVGQLLAALDRAGLAKDTLVVLTSDNGCSPSADYPELLGKGHNPSYVFRGNKADIFEGGHRVPFLVRWPAGAAGGRRSDQIVCLNDMVATCAEIAGAVLPAEAAEDSYSFLAALSGKSERPLRESIIHHSINGSFAIREGNWKLILARDSGGWSEPRPGTPAATELPDTQLYDLATDIGEKTNVASAHPDVVERLTKLLEKQVAEGRSTPGAKQPNAVEIRLRKKPPVRRSAPRAQ
jgi:arylsulfatase A-like enzyme